MIPSPVCSGERDDGASPVYLVIPGPGHVVHGPVSALRQVILCRYSTDGLNSLQYSLVAREERPLYTLLSVALVKDTRSRDVLGRARAARRG